VIILAAEASRIDARATEERVAREYGETDRAEAYDRGERHRVLVADPAWMFEDRLPGGGRGASKHYNVESLDQIKSQPLPPLFDDAVLFLWRVAAFGREAYEVMSAWGFEHKTEIVWFKRRACSRCGGEGTRKIRRYVEQVVVPGSGAAPRVYDGTTEGACEACAGGGETRHFGMGRIVRAEHEVCLIGTRGKATARVIAHDVRSAIETVEGAEIVAPTGAHSEKPEIFYKMVEALFPGPYFELHARRARPGWTTFGHQLDEATKSETGSVAPAVNASVPVCPRCLGVTPGEPCGNPDEPYTGPLADKLCDACEAGV
jgi:N6-adenosine-specific RNA methylase IME4